MNKSKIALALFTVGFLLAVAFASLGTWNLMENLRSLTMEEMTDTVWNLDGPMFMLWAFAVPLGSILAGIAAFIYAKTKPVFAWLTGIGVLVLVILMTIVWSRVYQPILFGVGGTISLLAFFAIVWIWMKRYAQADIQEKIAGSYKLIGYIFWINASWFLCGETGKLHLRAFEGDPMPSPIEIMVFLALGWLFVLLGEYKSRQLKTA